MDKNRTLNQALRQHGLRHHREGEHGVHTIQDCEGCVLFTARVQDAWRWLYSYEAAAALAVEEEPDALLWHPGHPDYYGDR